MKDLFSNKVFSFGLLITSIVSIVVITESCETTKKDKQGNCIINTSDNPKANGINIDVYYPCSWMEVHTNDYRPTLIKQVGDMPEDNNGNIGLTVMISQIKDTLTSDKIDSLRSEMYLKNKSIVEGVISADTLEINGVKGGKIITKNTLQSGQMLYNLMIQFFFKNNLIQLIYSVGAPTEDEAVSIFEKQKAIFFELAKKTKFYEN